MKLSILLDQESFEDLSIFFILKKDCYPIILHLFRREHGLEALYQAFERCVGVLSASSVDTDVAVDVCTHIIRCYSVAAQFQVLYTSAVHIFSTASHWQHSFLLL